MRTVDTYSITLYMAGDLDAVKRVVRRRCYIQGLCVTVTPTTFIYTGGEESGVAVGFVNYPRFPSTTEELWNRAREMVHDLLPACNQRTALLVAPDKTEWIAIDPPGAAKSEGASK